MAAGRAGISRTPRQAELFGANDCGWQCDGSRDSDATTCSDAGPSPTDPSPPAHPHFEGLTTPSTTPARSGRRGDERTVATGRRLLVLAFVAECSRLRQGHVRRVQMSCKVQAAAPCRSFSRHPVQPFHSRVVCQLPPASFDPTNRSRSPILGRLCHAFAMPPISPRRGAPDYHALFQSASDLHSGDRPLLTPGTHVHHPSPHPPARPTTCRPCTR